jgi:molybdate transport system ATP-binding protein
MSLLLSLHFQRGEFQFDIDAAVPSSGITAVCGPSGSGKTSLLRCIAGLEKSTGSMVQFKQQDWQTERDFIATEHRGIGLVFQNAQLFPHLSVEGNLQYAQKRQYQDAGPQIDEVCQWLHIKPLLKRRVDKLSGGESKRVAIARALLRHPQLLLMDEPLSGLHDQAREEMMDVLQELPRHLALPIIYVSHSFHEVSRLADHVLLLDQGQLIAEGDLVSLSTRLDLALSHQQDAGAVLEAQLQSHEDDYQLSCLTLDRNHRISVNRINANLGQPLRIFIAARDVSISLDAPSHSSIQNILGCHIDTIDSPQNSAQALIRLRLGRQFLLARITRKSCQRLQLVVGQAVFAQIKTVALINEYGVNP